MRISCPQCNSQYNVDEKRIPPQGVQIKCPKCLHAFVVTAPADSAVALPGGGGGAVALPGGSGAVALPGGGGGGAVPLPGGGGSGGAVPLPGFGGGGAVPLPGGGGGGPVPLPGGARGAVPLPGGAGAVPLPGGGGGGAVPLPGMPAGGAVALPGGFGGAAVPLPSAMGGTASPMSAFPTGARSLGVPAAETANPLENSVVAPFHGESTHTHVPVPPPPQAQPLNAGVLDFIDRAAADAPAQKKAVVVRIRKRSGKVVGPFDEATILRMLRSHELMGSEEGSEDGITWKPLTQFQAFAHEIQALMASALSGLGDLPAAVSAGGRGFADLPAPVAGGRGGFSDLPAPVAGGRGGFSDLPAPVGGGGGHSDLPTSAGGGRGGLGDLPAPVSSNRDLPAPMGGARPPSDDPFADIADDLPVPRGMALPAVPDMAGDAGAEPGQVQAKPTKPKKPARAARKIRSVSFGLAIGVGGGLLLLTTGLVTEFVVTDVGAFGRKKIAALINPPPPPKPVEAPKPKVHIPVWENASLEALLAEDNLASYQEAQKKLRAQLEGGAAEAARTLARALVVPAYLDELPAMADEAEAVLARSAETDVKFGAAIKAFVALARGKPEDAWNAVSALAASAMPDTRDMKDAQRVTEALAQRAVGFVFLARNKPAEAMNHFDASLSAEPASVVTSLAQARTLQAIGDQDGAQGYMERAVALQPDNIRTRLALGEVLIKRGKFRQAEAMLQHVSGSAGAKGSSAQRATAHVLLSDLATAEKDFKAAAEELKLAVAEMPGDVSLRVRSGEMLLRLREWAQARKAFDEILQTNPALESAIIGDARAKIGATDALGGYKQLEDAVTKNPQSALLHYWFGHAAEALSKIPDAVKLYRKSETLDPKKAAPVAAQARLLMAERKLPAALAMLQSARSRVASDEEPVIRAMLAQVAFKQKNYPLAFSEFEEALKAMPGNTEARAMYGAALREQGRFDEAQKQLKQALSEDPRNAMILAENGSFAMSQGQYERAIDFFQQAIAVAPKEADFYVRMGAATFQKGDSAGALEFLKTAQSLAPTSPDVFFWMALAIRKTDPEKAKALLKLGSEQAPDEGRFDHELGRSVLAEGAVLEALDYLRAAVRKDPKNGEAYFEMGKALMEQARYADALDQLKRAVEVMPKKGFIHMYMGDCHLKTGQYDLARREYETAIKKDSTLSEAHCKLGDVTRTDNKLKLAIGHYEKCVELNPKHKDAWRWLGYSLIGLGGRPNQKKAIEAFERHLKVNPTDPDNEDVRDQIADLRGSR